MKTIAVFFILMTSGLSGSVGKQFNWKNVVQSDFEPSRIQERHISGKLQYEGRLFGGTLANPYQFPYQVGMYLLKYADFKPSTYWCGASLISSRVVLTAAHCLEGVSAAVLVLGSSTMKDDDQEKVLVGVNQTSFIIHKNYDRLQIINDIALVMLPKNVILNEKVQIINLPQPSQDQSSLENKLAVITGWGQTGDGQDVSMDLRYAILRILPDALCQTTYPLIFRPTQICVSGDNMHSVCAGDSGGPLVVEETDKSKAVVGLVSYGRRQGCELGYPTVFTRVTSYLDWIKEHGGVSPKNYKDSRLKIDFFINVK